MVVTTEAFLELTRESARTVGLPDARIAVVPHPIGATAEPVLLERAEAAVDALIELYRA